MKLTNEVDMSPEAITGRMMMLDQLWELTVALKSSKIGENVEKESCEIEISNDSEPSRQSSS